MKKILNWKISLSQYRLCRMDNGKKKLVATKPQYISGIFCASRYLGNHFFLVNGVLGKWSYDIEFYLLDVIVVLLLVIYG